jgi:hypothetical protein
MLPATRLSVSRSRASDRPSSPALAPKMANMIEKPRMNASVGRMTLFHRAST